jgi:aryl-alcohol dehydrogenase-like predicted oxidoreductase
VLPATRELGIGYVAYSPLGRGFLAGQESSGKGDRRTAHPRFAPESVAANRVRRAAIEAVAARHGVAVGQISLAWVLAQNTVPIPGTRHIAHLEQNWAANNIVLSEADIAELEAAFPPGTTAGTRYPAEQLTRVNV